MADLFKLKYRYCSLEVNEFRDPFLEREISRHRSSFHTTVIVMANIVFLGLKYELESVHCAARNFDLEVEPLV